MGKYDHLEREHLIRLLERRDAERQLGLVWEREELDPEAALNQDFVALEQDASLSHGDAPWPNLIIEGDNYDALRALRISHAGRIRCIYIDPPYNTGNRDFVYNDRFVDQTHRFRHSLWLEFMHQRLVLARELLADDGVIFVSIDDNELFRLGMLMDRVFGEDNFVGICTWERKRKGSHLSKKFTKKTDYVLISSKHGKDIELFGSAAGEDEDQPLIKKTNSTKTLVFPPDTIETKLPDGIYNEGIYGTGASSTRLLAAAHVVNGRVTNELPVEARFVWDQNNLTSEAIAGARFFVKSKKFSIRALKSTENQGFKALGSLLLKEVGTNESASAELAEIMGTSVEAIPIDYPKPSSLIELLVRAGLVNEPDGIILDFFAGSGTTAHAVAKLNAEDGGNRRFILVSSTEATEDEPGKNLCRDVCAERVRRVLGGYTNAKGERVEGLGGGFAYLRTRRIAPYRVSTRIAHDEVWRALQLIADRALTPWQGHGFQHDGTLGYLADFRAASLAALRAWLGDSAGAGHTLYAWTPQRLATIAPEADLAPIPDFLQARFGR
jgi:adenine-specific DNA-methyltransferase